jgi:hypothetical protein
MITQTSVVPRFPLGSTEPFPVPAPSFWAVTWNSVRRLIIGPPAAAPPNAARDSLLLDACVAIRAGRVDDAAELLRPHAAALANDAAYLNLLGVVCELRRQWRLSRRFYGLALSGTPRYTPAHRNLRRYYELSTFGRSREPVALGDVELRRDRTLPPTTHDAK